MRLLLITYFFSVVAFSFAQERDSLYNKGLEALSTKDYNSAQKYFIQNVEISPSFEGYYNLGFAYAEQQKWSESLWANEAALKYNPTNSKAIYNAKFSLEKISPDAEWNHPYTWTERIILSIGETTWFILMVLSSIIVAVSAYFLISIKKTNAKYIWSKRLIFPFAILLVLSVFCFNEVLNHYEGNKYAYSLSKETVLFLSPNGIEVEGDLPLSSRLNVIQDQEGWVQVQTPDFRNFWVKRVDVLVY